MIKGLGPAKRAELVAVLELSRRGLAEQLRQRQAFHAPEAVKAYVQLHLAHKNHEVFELHPKSWTPIQHLGCFSWRSTTRNLRNQ